MKKLTILLFLFSFISLISLDTTAKENRLVWNNNLEKAVDIAKKQDKAILINFSGSDWCKWCKKLDSEVFSQNEFINYAKKNLVLVKIDFPQYTQQDPAVQSYNKEVAQMFKVQGFPTVVVIDKNQKLAAYTGYQEGGAGNYVQYLKSVLNKK
ncbi:MAG: thioredoxin fold domain-containing protein [Ignavibacteriaceae bacterium]